MRVLLLDIGDLGQLGRVLEDAAEIPSVTHVFDLVGRSLQQELYARRPAMSFAHTWDHVQVDATLEQTLTVLSENIQDVYGDDVASAFAWLVREIERRRTVQVADWRAQIEAVLSGEQGLPDHWRITAMEWHTRPIHRHNINWDVLDIDPETGEWL